MKRVLILTYHFPPRPTIGSVRLGGLAKYLSRYGWEPVIVTATYPGREEWPIPVLETADRDVVAELKRRLGLEESRGLQEQLGVSGGRRGLKASVVRLVSEIGRTVLCYPDAQRGWFPYALEAAIDAVRQFGCLAILSSSSPVTSHLVAKVVKTRLGLPWVADLRDLWIDNHYARRPAWRLFLERRLERETLGRADTLITVSDPLAATLKRRFTEVPVYTVLNGFDPDECAQQSRLSSDFTLRYTGSLYGGKRDPTPLIEALARLASAGRIDRSKVKVGFYGPESARVLQLASAYKVEDMVYAHPAVPRQESLQLQRESQALLLLNWNHPSERGVYPGKLFEYLGARRPILAVGGPRGVVADLLDETKAGVYAPDSSSVERVLTAWWQSYSHSGAVPYDGDVERVAGYSHLHMARRVAAVLDQVVS